MLLTEQNYHSSAANMEYMSVSSYKNYLECESMALASDMGKYIRPTSTECLVGSYIHAWNAGEVEQFKSNTPDMFSSKGATKGQPKANFLYADKMIEVLERDPICSFMLQGEKERIITAEMFGTPWKTKIDTYRPTEAIVDLKTTRSIYDLTWDNFYRCKVSFIEAYQYFIQAAVYCEVERLAMGRMKHLPFYIVAVSKQDPPDKEVISLADPERIERELQQIEANAPRILAIKAGEEKPRSCGRCSYCRSRKVITDIISYRDLEGGIAI